jgi:hypothetical protein
VHVCLYDLLLLLCLSCRCWQDHHNPHAHRYVGGRDELWGLMACLVAVFPKQGPLWPMGSAQKSFLRASDRDEQLIYRLCKLIKHSLPPDTQQYLACRPACSGPMALHLPDRSCHVLLAEFFPILVRHAAAHLWHSHDWRQGHSATDVPHQAEHGHLSPV